VHSWVRAYASFAAPVKSARFPERTFRAIFSDEAFSGRSDENRGYANSLVRIGSRTYPIWDVALS